MEKVRAYWFSKLLRDHFKNDRKAFLGATKLSKGRITHLVNDGFGDVAAKRLLDRLAESGHNLPSDYFDRPIPEEDAAPSSVVAITLRQMPLLEAFEVLAFALSRMPPGKRRKAIEHLADYAADPSEEVERQSAIELLLGESSQKTEQHKQMP